MDATPSQLVFGRDAILNTQFKADWHYIKNKKQSIVHKNNQRENAGCIPHKYKPGDKVLFYTKPTSKYGHDPWEGPCTIIEAMTMEP